MRTRVLAMATTGLAAATLAFGIPAQAVASTGGGCSSGGTGGAIAACISANSTDELPDMYINWMPAGNACQSVEFYIVDNTTGGRLWGTGIPCQTGHFSPWKIPATNWHEYQSYVQYTGQSRTLYQPSPIQTFSN